MAEHAKQVHMVAERFGINQLAFAVVPAAGVLDVVGRALREAAVQQVIPLEPPVSETVKRG